MTDFNFTTFLNTYGVAGLFLVVVFYIWFYEKKPEEAKHAMFSAVLAGVVVMLLKELFNVPRPFEVTGEIALAGQTISGSFPSLHTALGFSVATTIVLHQKRTGIVLFLLAFLIGWGRVMANVHFPIDVVSGGFIGVTVAFVIEKYHI